VLLVLLVVSRVATSEVVLTWRNVPLHHLQEGCTRLPNSAS
jgi:hypothetical protein